MIEGLRRFPLERRPDERGWFAEIARVSTLGKPILQVNLTRSRRGVLRGLHYHERGQDDVFVCLEGMVRVVVLDRTTGEAFSEDIGDHNPVAIYVPGLHAHGYEALSDALFAYLVTEEYDPADPDEHGICWADPRIKHLWNTEAPTLSARDAAVCGELV
jgi:dTDP-4-dehydrorhamnose 3,5-epimerase